MAEINVLSLSYGKDSLACLGACEQLGIPIHKIVHAEVWATDEISADLPPMVEFKKKADAIIKERWGLEVEHICAMTTPGEKNGFFHNAPLMRGAEKHTNGSSTPQQTLESTEYTSTDSLANEGHGVNTSSQMMKLTYEDIFYRPIKNPRKRERDGTASRSCEVNGVQEYSRAVRYGYPTRACPWCTGMLKGAPQDRTKKLFSNLPQQQGAETNTVVSLLGIAADEPERIERHMKKPNIRLPLVEIGWTEAYCRKWCEENDLLSPIYTTSARGGCWFCHNQSIGQLRLLRKNYPDLWALLMKWDLDSPVTFKPDGHTVHDYDNRFEAEDKGLVPTDRKFRWSMLNDVNDDSQLLLW